MQPVAIFRHLNIEGPSYFAMFLDYHSIPWRLVRIDENDQLPDGVDGYSGLVFIGRADERERPDAMDRPGMRAYPHRCGDGHSRVGPLPRRAADRQGPGGVVTKNPAKEIGWGEIKLVDGAETHARFIELPGFLSFQLAWRDLFSIPKALPTATHVLEGPYCTHQAYA